MQPKKGKANDSETYEEYVDKFKEKRTKDDTFTLPEVYNTVKDCAYPYNRQSDFHNYVHVLQSQE